MTAPGRGSSLAADEISRPAGEVAGRPVTAAARLVTVLAGRGETVAMAESLTGGLLTAAVVDVPGASAVLRGAVVAYATSLKHDVLGVDAALLSAHGPVHPLVAGQMAAGVRLRLGADWGVATTGVAGPGPQDGVPAGRAYVAVSGPAGQGAVRELTVDGGRAQVRAGCVAGALSLLENLLVAEPWPDPAQPGTGT